MSAAPARPVSTSTVSPSSAVSFFWRSITPSSAAACYDFAGLVWRAHGSVLHSGWDFRRALDLLPQPVRQTGSVASFSKPVQKCKGRGRGDVTAFTCSHPRARTAFILWWILRLRTVPRLIPLSQVDQYLGLAGGVRNGAGF